LTNLKVAVDLRELVVSDDLLIPILNGMDNEQFPGVALVQSFLAILLKLADNMKSERRRAAVDQVPKLDEYATWFYAIAAVLDPVPARDSAYDSVQKMFAAGAMSAVFPTSCCPATPTIRIVLGKNKFLQALYTNEYMQYQTVESFSREQFYADRGRIDEFVQKHCGGEDPLSPKHAFPAEMHGQIEELVAMITGYIKVFVRVRFRLPCKIYCLAIVVGK
jgi:hypothetical protein